jgi:hypothetical protein
MATPHRIFPTALLLLLGLCHPAAAAPTKANYVGIPLEGYSWSGRFAGMKVLIFENSRSRATLIRLGSTTFWVPFRISIACIIFSGLTLSSITGYWLCSKLDKNGCPKAVSLERRDCAPSSNQKSLARRSAA